MIHLTMPISKSGRLLGALVLGLFVGGDPMAATQVSAAAVAAVSKLRATKMGVDHLGNLWAWNIKDGSLRFLSPAGELDSRPPVPMASTVDADARWGVVGLFNGGRLLRWVQGQGKPDLDLALSDSASDVCWIAADTAAVTPQRSPQRIEIWNIRDRKLIRTLGAETPVRPTAGATRLRSLVLRYDFTRETLYSLDSFTGDLQVFNRTGDLLWRAAVANPDREKLEAWLREMDASAKAGGTADTPVFFSMFLSPGPDGSAWVTQQHDRSSGTVTLVRVSPQTSQKTILPAESCATRTFIIWGTRMIFHVDPAAPRDVCTNSRELP